MSLDLLIKSLGRGEILLPRLKQFLVSENKAIISGKMKHKEVVRLDAQMTIDCFKERLATYNHHEPVGEYFHPSQLGHCLRALWYHHVNAPKNSSPSGDDLLRSHIVFEMGTYIHVLFQNLCDRAGILSRREFLAHSVLHKIIGHADGVLKIDSNKYLLEIKTINARRFSLVKKEPLEAHKQQMMAYMKALNLKWAIIVYIEKDKAATREFVLPYSEAFYQEKCAPRIKQHFKNLLSTKPPQREGTNPSKMPCSYCEFSKVCFETKAAKQFESSLCASKSVSRSTILRLNRRMCSVPK